MCPNFCYCVVVDNVVIRVLQGLPIPGNWLHKPFLRDPEQFAVNARLWVHAEEAGVLLDLLFVDSVRVDFDFFIVEVLDVEVVDMALFMGHGWAQKLSS